MLREFATVLSTAGAAKLLGCRLALPRSGFAVCGLSLLELRFKSLGLDQHIELAIDRAQPAHNVADWVPVLRTSHPRTLVGVATKPPETSPCRNEA